MNDAAAWETVVRGNMQRYITFAFVMLEDAVMLLHWQ